MAARRGPHVIKLQDANPPLLGRAPGPRERDAGSPPVGLLRQSRAISAATHPAIAELEERLAFRDREIQEVLIDNQRFAATHVALQQQLIAAQHELRAVSVAATRARAEREEEVRALADQAAHIEAEARAVAAAREEVDRVHADVQVLAGARTDLMNRLQGLREKVPHMQVETAKAGTVRTQIEAMRREIQKGRAAVEFEKKAHADNLEQSKAMEQNMITVASEIEKLRGEVAAAVARAAPVTPAAAVANSGYAATYANPTYGNSAYTSTYSAYSYPEAYSANQAQMRTDASSHYMTQPVSYGQYDGQHTNVPK